MKRVVTLTILAGAIVAMTQAVFTSPDAATDSNIRPTLRSFLAEVNKDNSPYWEKPGPEVRATLTGLQAKTPVDMSGVTITDRMISENGRTVKLYIMKPENVTGKPPVFMFFHGAVWIAGNFENHKRLVRDLVVGSGAVAVFPEYTPVPRLATPSRSSRPTRRPCG